MHIQYLRISRYISFRTILRRLFNQFITRIPLIKTTAINLIFIPFLYILIKWALVFTDLETFGLVVFSSIVAVALLIVLTR